MAAQLFKYVCMHVDFRQYKIQIKSISTKYCNRLKHPLQFQKKPYSDSGYSDEEKCGTASK